MIFHIDGAPQELAEFFSFINPELKTRIEKLILFIIKLEGTIMTAITDLQDAVAAESTVVASAVTLLQGLKAQLDAAIASGNPAALVQLSADIAAQTKALADAVVANTPVVTPPVVTPPVV